MFDIGFWELVLIAVVGLLVLGPERLPTAVRSVARTISTIKRYGAAVRDQVEQELQIEQLHQDLKKAEALGQNVTPELQASLNKLRAKADSVTRPYAVDQTAELSDEDRLIASSNASGHQEYPKPDAVEDLDRRLPDTPKK